MDIECPYCDILQDINHEDGYGYQEDELCQQTCISCDKTFGYTTGILYVYTPHLMPCANGGEHELRDMRGIPSEDFHGMKRCIHCNEPFDTEPEERKKKMDEYHSK